MGKNAVRILLVLLAVCFAGCAAAQEEKPFTAGDSSAVLTVGDGYVLLEGYAMDTLIRLEYWGTDAEAAAKDGFTCLSELEDTFSVTDPESEVFRLNGEGFLEDPSEDTLKLLSLALAAWEETDGAFDPALLPLKKAWGWLGDEPSVPDPDELASALALCGGRKVTLGSSSVRLEEGCEVDLGGIAKGYAAALLAQRASSHDITAALINLGGNIQTYGHKSDGTAWNIGIRDPEDPSGLLGVLSLSGRNCVVTSGAYERSFTENGVTYGHILNGETGMPADAGLISVSVTGTDTSRADALSTALFVMGEEGAKAFWREHRDFGMVLLDSDGTVWVSEDIAEDFRTERSVQTIH